MLPDLETMLADEIGATAKVEPTRSHNTYSTNGRLSLSAKDFIENGAPIGEQRSSACAVARTLLDDTGMSEPDATAAIWAGLQRSAWDNAKGAWTYEQAEAIVASIARSTPPPRRPLGGAIILDGVRRKPADEEPTPDPTDIDQVVAKFQQWLHLPDVTPLLAVLGAVAANMLPGDPTWLLVVGPPSGGKTEILQSIRRVPRVHPAATLTEAALLSGTPKRDAVGAKGGLLREIADWGIILCKDFGSVLSMNRDARAQLLAALREVYDGEWTRHLGTDGGKTLHWEGKVGLIAGCTGEIDRHHAVIAAMGERFLTCRLKEIDDIALAQRALLHVNSMGIMRAELAQIVVGLFARELEPTELTDEDRIWLSEVASLVVRCRSAVDRDGYSREVELIPGAEAPGRLATSLARLLSGLQAIGVDYTEARRVTAAVALDSMPAIRRMALEHLARCDEPVLTDKVALAANYPKNTMQRALEDLHAYGVVERSRKGEAANAALTWALSDWARTYHERTEAPPKC